MKRGSTGSREQLSGPSSNLKAALVHARRRRGETAALAVQQVPMPAPTPGRCLPWGTCTPHTPCRIAEKPSCNTAWSKPQLYPPHSIYRAHFASLLALAPSCCQVKPDPALGASCISAQRCCWNKASISALSFHTAPGFQPSACKALHWDLFQHCQEYAAHSSVSSGSIPEPLAVGKRCQVLVPPVPQEGAPSSHPRTYPTDSARGFVDSSETKTWQANLWSAGCLVMNPKYLRVNRASEIGLADRQK